MPKLDEEKYLKYLESFDLTDEQRRECIRAAWYICENEMEEYFKVPEEFMRKAKEFRKKKQERLEERQNKTENNK